MFRCEKRSTGSNGSACRRVGQICNGDSKCCGGLACRKTFGDPNFKCEKSVCATSRNQNIGNTNVANRQRRRRRKKKKTSRKQNVGNKNVANRQRRRKKLKMNMDCVGANRRCKGTKGKRCCNPYRCDKETNRCSMPGF